MNAGPVITPQTTIADLLAEWPRLEVVLIDLLPAFRQLHDPALRQQVAAVTTLQHAADVAGIKVEQLLGPLRHYAGEPAETAAPPPRDDQSERPDWAHDQQAVKSLDAGALLQAGQQPIKQIMIDISELSTGEVYRVTAPFLPQPLIEKLGSMGWNYWADQSDPSRVAVYFLKPNEEGA